MPRVSIIVPTHNRADFLQGTLDSVLAQTFDDFEILVVDDGSTDDTAACVRAFSDTRVQLIQQSQQERAAARNNGIEHARGEYLAFLDDDDLWQPDFLARTIDAFTSPQLGVVYGGWSFIDARSEPLPEAPHLPQIRGTGRDDFFRACFFPTSAALVRRARLDQVGAFDASLVPVEDWDLWLRMAIRGIEFNFVPAPLLRYRLHEQNSTNALERVETSARALLTKTFAALDPSFADARTQAFARWDYNCAVKRFGVGQSERGCEYFVRAVRALPSLLDEPATYYQIICAMQPDGYKGTNERLDLTQGRAYIERALVAYFAHEPSHPTRRDALGKAYLTLARLHYARHEMSAARACLRRAMQENFSLVTRTPLWSLWFKSFLPPSVLAQRAARRAQKAAA